MGKEDARDENDLQRQGLFALVNLGNCFGVVQGEGVILPRSSLGQFNPLVQTAQGGQAVADAGLVFASLNDQPVPEVPS